MVHRAESFQERQSLPSISPTERNKMDGFRAKITRLESENLALRKAFQEATATIGDLKNNLGMFTIIHI